MVWFTGLPGSGKTTVSTGLAAALTLRGQPCVVIDGDALRAGISRDLGFSDHDRALQALRAAALAREAADQGQMALVALVSPFDAHRVAAFTTCGPHRVLCVYVATPAAVCARRDQRGLWSGTTSGLTGREAPYEPPAQPDLTLDLTHLSQVEAVERVLALLV